MRAASGLLFFLLVLLPGACSVMPGQPSDDDADSGRRTVLTSAAGPVMLHSEEAGQGAPIVLLHGYGLSTYSWRHIRIDLARTHHVIALDLKGFGRSQKPLDDAYGVNDQAALIVDFLRVRKLNRVTLIGHSFGGAVAIAVALELNRTEPKRLQRLVLLDSPAFAQKLPAALSVLRTPYVAEAAMSAVPPEAAAAGALMLAYKDPSRIAAADIAAYARPLYDAGTRHALIRTAERIVPDNLAELTNRYRTIRQPTLIIWCRDDRIVPLVIGFQLVASLPAARLEVLDTCGHLPHEEAPAATLAAIQRFLAPAR